MPHVVRSFEPKGRASGGAAQPWTPSAAPLDDAPRRDGCVPDDMDAMGAAWRAVRHELLAEFGPADFRSYIDKLEVVALDGATVVLRADTATAQHWQRRYLAHRLEARLAAHLGGVVTAEFKTAAELPAHLRAAAPVGADTAFGLDAAPATAPDAAAGGSLCFDTFCVDDSNRRAHTVAQMIAVGAGHGFPLVLIHGPPGVGKTHLLSAIAHETARAGAGRRVRLLMAQLFIEEFQNALNKRRDAASFKAMVRDCHILLIDDAHRIAGKRATEEEFFDTIAILNAAGKQVVLTADHGPDGLSGFDDRLRHQLKGATDCAITEPDEALRRRILAQRAQHYAALHPGFHVPDEVLDMIARRMPVTGRQLDGAICQLVVETRISGLNVSIESAENALQGKFKAEQERRITVDQIQRATARHFNLTVSELLQRSRQRAIARPRQIAMYLATRNTVRSLPDLGKRFGGRDHTTVMHARDTIADLLATDRDVRAAVEAIERQLRREV